MHREEIEKEDGQVLGWDWAWGGKTVGGMAQMADGADGAGRRVGVQWVGWRGGARWGRALSQPGKTCMRGASRPQGSSKTVCGGAQGAGSFEGGGWRQQ